MAKARYPVDTLNQIAAIPDEALPRFMAEFPDFIRTWREFGKQDLPGVVSIGAVWIDDDDGEIRLSVNGEVIATAPLDQQDDN